MKFSNKKKHKILGDVNFIFCLKLPAASKDTRSASIGEVLGLNARLWDYVCACCDFREEFSKKIKEGWGGI